MPHLCVKNPAPVHRPHTTELTFAHQFAAFRVVVIMCVTQGVSVRIACVLNAVKNACVVTNALQSAVSAIAKSTGLLVEEPHVGALAVVVLYV